MLNRATLSQKSRDAIRLTEAVMVVCLNPKCRREFEAPILLTILSVTPPKQYEACPYCFTNLEQGLPIKQKEHPEPTIIQEEAIDAEEEEETEDNLSVNAVLEKVKDSAPRLLKKVKDLIPNSNGFKNEKREKIEAPQAEPSGKEETMIQEEPRTERFAKEESEEKPQTKAPVTEAAKQEPKTEQSAKKESGVSCCPQTFGYLANRPKDAPIPSDCLLCLKMVDCMLKTEAD